ncbi:MAG TPA: alpha-glucuronidase family glycosyl hydrolase [Cyclobacteriaceae bacterium]|nr:alpha-glucuronidase family glycosyl hydrolase [Cyclobacteriaceae bacterium]HRJ83226.1 alpha-glucuronidase family glycosyl hydrolase [Cyclobacteriaceae bacterium]
MRKLPLLYILFLTFTAVHSEDGYRLWLRYDPITNKAVATGYKKNISGWMVYGNSPTLSLVKKEIQQGLAGLIGNIPEVKTPGSSTVLLGTPQSSEIIRNLNLDTRLKNLGNEGFLILTTTYQKKKLTVIAAPEEIGVLYGAFHFLKLLQTHQPIDKLDIESSPRINLRVLNHWDNLDRTVERGYAGFSLWDWHKLPDYIDPRYHDYARANASIGINGTVVTNVNANARVLSEYYLEKVAALADVFRPYGIRIYLTARFSAPIELGGLKTADPLDPTVQQWWNDKVKEIYTLIPDFGGFLVKANSEGQPGPQNYNRNHADGANMLADAVAPFNGIVMWRAFVYDDKVPDDRAKQAYNEFKPLDGTFRKNVLIQVKNGAIDFQPREPFHPMFGTLPHTPLMMEFQITQEYTGFSTHLVYLANQFKECLDADTHAKGTGSTVAKVIDGSLDNHSRSGIAGVANIGTDRNWTGHPFAQANWYAFGRLAWDHQLSAQSIAEEWIKMTFTNDQTFVNPIKEIMDKSWETNVSYMTPLGLHHIMGWSHHYGPAPWIKDKHRADWTSVYYHQASKEGIGFNRSSTGSNAIAQYNEPVARLFGSREQCPEKFLLWFHHVGWDEKLKSGKTLWEEICRHYYAGAEEVKSFQQKWNTLEGKVDQERFEHVKMLLAIQYNEAIWWRNACVLYFQSFSGLPIPNGLEKPDQPLEYYMNLEFPYAPGIRPQW